MVAARLFYAQITNVAMGLLDRIKKARINSLWSVWYCVAVVGLQIYVTYVAIKRYNRGVDLEWGGTTVPGQLSTSLAFIVLSVLFLPLFCLACVFKVGNYPNDGVKFGRDHVPTVGGTESRSSTPYQWAVTFWEHFCPISQTLHLINAFLLLIPETLQTAVEIEHGHKTSDHMWSSDVDFFFPAHRASLTDLKAAGNYNETTFWSDIQSRNAVYNSSPPSVAFGNFAVALVAFSVRFSAVYWYTNKILSAIFAVTLIAMSINSLFAFSAFSVLYKATLNFKRCPEIVLHLNVTTIGVLFCLAGIITLLATITLFEYGFYFFHEKFKISTNKKTRNMVKQTVIVWATCRGYVPHITAMSSLIIWGFFKGPLMYDYTKIYLITKDRLLLATIICEVAFMMLWIILWFSLTIKQQWHFKILDYQKVSDPVFTVESADRIRHPAPLNDTQYDAPRKNQNLEVESAMNDYVTVRNRSDDDNDMPSISDQRSSKYAGDKIAVDESDPRNPVIINGVLIRKTKNRRSNPGQRVTFSENVKTNSTPTEKDMSDGVRRNLCRSESANAPQMIRAQVHDRRRYSDPSVMEIETANYDGIVNGHENLENHLQHEYERGQGEDSCKLNQDDRNYKNSRERLSPTHESEYSAVSRDSNCRDEYTNDNYELRKPLSRTDGDSCDNTLVRDYRKNIRSKCDEYYMEVGSSGSVCSSELSPRGIVCSMNNDGTKRLSNSSHLSDLSSVSSRPSMMSDQSRIGGHGGLLYIKPNALLHKSSSLDHSRGSPLSDTSDFGSKRSADSPLSTSTLQPLEIRINNAPLSSYMNSSVNSPLARSDNQSIILGVGKTSIVRRDSANYSMSSSSQETSSNDSENGRLCSQV